MPEQGRAFPWSQEQEGFWGMTGGWHIGIGFSFLLVSAVAARTEKRTADAPFRVTTPAPHASGDGDSTACAVTGLCHAWLSAARCPEGPSLVCLGAVSRCPSVSNWLDQYFKLFFNLSRDHKCPLKLAREWFIQIAKFLALLLNFLSANDGFFHRHYSFYVLNYLSK